MRLFGAHAAGADIPVHPDAGASSATVARSGEAAISRAITHEPTHVHGTGADSFSV